MVKPFFYNLIGMPFQPCMFEGRVAERISRKKTGRIEFRPVRTDGGYVYPIEYGGSSDLRALSKANGLVRFEPDTKEFPKESFIGVRQI